MEEAINSPGSQRVEQRKEDEGYGKRKIKKKRRGGHRSYSVDQV